MTGRHRFIVVACVLLAVLGGLGLVAFAASACPGASATDACPDAGRNRAIVVGLAAASVATVSVPFAFLTEFVLRRRIVYRGAWARAIRRGLIVGAMLGALAGLRLGGALTVPVGIFVVVLGALVEWYAVRRLDGP